MPESDSRRVNGVFLIYNFGGIAGNNDDGTIENCHASGAVSGYNRVGGIAGSTGGQIINSTPSSTLTVLKLTDEFGLYDRRVTMRCSWGPIIPDRNYIWRHKNPNGPLFDFENYEWVLEE